jgi:hypothetical protein
MLITLLGTLVTYLLSLIALKSIFDLSYLSPENIGKIVAITLISWLPFYLTVKIKQLIYPEVHEKLNSI